MKLYPVNVNSPKYKESNRIPAATIGIAIVKPAIKNGTNDRSFIILISKSGTHPIGEETLVIKDMLRQNVRILTFLSNLSLTS